MWLPLGKQEIFCNKPRTLLSSLYVHLNQCAKLLSKQLEENFKNLLGMELVTDVTFLVPLSANKEESKYLTSKDRFFDKEKTHFKALNNQEEYFRRYENICCMVFLIKMLMTSLHAVFKIYLGLIYDQWLSFACKNHNLLFYVCSGKC